MVEREYMRPAETVTHRSRCIPVVVVGLHVLIGLLAELTVHVFPVAEPVVTVRCSVNIPRKVVVVCRCQHHVKSLCQKVTFTVFQRWHNRTSRTRLLAEHHLLYHAVLYFLVHLRVCHAEYKPVGPRLVQYPEFANHCLVVVRIMETPNTLYLRIVKTR